jgi:RHS repeat-associated protein
MQEVMSFATNLGVKNLTSKINQSDSKSVAQTFDANNNLTCRKDEENRVTLYNYNPTNQKQSMTEGLSGTDCNTCIANPANCNGGGVGRVTTYDYFSPTLDLPRFIRRPSVIAGQTFETEIQYGDAGHPNLPTQIIQRGFTPSNASVSRTVTLGYNASGQVNSINGPRLPSDPGMNGVDDITTLDYYACTTGGACGQLKKTTNALGHITIYDLYDGNGRLIQMTGPNGLRTSYTYDARGRVKTITQTPTSGSAAITQYSYTPWGDVSQVIDPDGVVLNYQYDAAHYLRTITDLAGNQIRYKYDLKGNRIQDYIYDPSGALTRTVSATYDPRNHPSSATLANDTTQLVYDAVGNLMQETDPNTYITAHTPDALNRLFRTVDALNGMTGYGYDVNDRPLSVTAPNNLSTLYQYDDLGNLLKETSPDRGTTNYTYDAAGNVLTVKDARKITTTYAYDALNRVVSKQSSNASTPRYAYYYDSCFRGRLCYLSRNGITQLLFGYDEQGRLNYQLDLNSMLYSYHAYTSGGRLSQITYPTGRTVDYDYDALGQVRQVSTTAANGTTTVLAQGFQYYPFGPLKNFSFGNGQAYSVNVDQAYRPTFQRSGPRLKNAYYDPAGNLDTLADFSTTQTFAYDALNGLTGATDTQAGGYGDLSWLYDQNGNRQSETRDGTPTAYIYNPASSNNLSQVGDDDYRIMGSGGYPTWTSSLYVVGHDGYGRMTSALSGAATYEYNAFDQRTKKVAGGVTTRFAYGPNGELLYETGGGGKAYVYLNGMPLARVDNDTNLYYYHTDPLGAPQAMTNSAGAVVWRGNYEPFGRATVTLQTIQNNLRYAGQYFDAETGLYYNGARYYDPKIGGYITAEPLGVVPGVASSATVPREITEYFQSIPLNKRLLRGLNHPYRYAYNNPLTYIDPDGLMGQGAGGGKSMPGPLRFGGGGAAPTAWGPPPGPFGPVCGPAGTNHATWIPDAHFGASFSGACEEHDECYDCSGRPRKDCDDDFCKTLLKSCAAQYGAGFGRQSCDRMARAYCRAVRENGQQYYKK